jgi:hypothetical protein
MAPSLVVNLIDSIPDVYAPVIASGDPYSWTPEDADAYDTTPAAEFSGGAGIALVPPAPPKKPTLRDRMERVAYIADTIEALDDEAMTDDLRDHLSEQLVVELAGTREKVDAVANVLAMFEGLAATAEKEIERLAKRANRYTRQAKRLEVYVLAVMSASKLDRIDGETSTLVRRLNPPKVVIDDGAAIGHEFMFYPEAPPPHPDKGAIKKALLAKRKVAGARLERGERLARS